MQKIKFTIGIDEVGRGPVAGPVAVGALMVSEDKIKEVIKMFEGFKDSKKLSPKKRNEWFVNIRQAKEDGLLNYKVVFVDNNEIDKNGIAPSIRVCINKSLKQLQKCWAPDTPHFCWVSGAQHLGKRDFSEVLVLLDGGLKAPEKFVNQKTIIKGDEKELLIALASIVAKVTRDALMCKFAKKYPEYEFEKHKGYGTKKHMEAIKKYGLCEIHRRSFLKKIN
ncbi:MAG TPA: ribonuclease HII [Candidatus Moranbacteria bacterium]|nr:ribonuclease HII [Candidatus Moranbacteria bacterium]